MKKNLTLVVCGLIAVLFANAQTPCPWLAPNKVDVTKCENDASLSSTALIASTTEQNPTWQWYSDAALSQPITDATGSTYNPTGTIPGTTTYYVRFNQFDQSSGVACWSPSTIVTRTVYAKPAKPIFAFATQSMCQSATVAPLFTVTNVSGTINWFDNGLTATGTTYTPTLPSKSLTKTFKAIQTENGCVSDTNTATLVLIPTPPAPATTNDQVICVYNNQKYIYASASGPFTLKWYKNLTDIGTSNYVTGSSYLPSGYNKPQTDGAASEVNLFYVTQTTSGANLCEGPKATVKLTVNSKPLAPVLEEPYILFCAYPTSSDKPLVAQNNAANSTIEWYNYNTGLALTAADGIVSGNNSSYFTPSLSVLKPSETLKYSVKVKDAAGCYSDPAIGTFRVSKDINVTPILLTDIEPFCYEAGQSKLFEAFAKGSRFTWKLNDTLVQGSDSLKFFFTPHQAGTYKIALSQVYDFKDTNVTYTLPCPGPGYSFVQEVKSVPKVNVIGDSILNENRTSIPYLILTTNSLDEFTWSTTKNRIGYIQQANNNTNKMLFLDFIGEPGFDTLRVSEYNGACYGYDSLIIFSSGKSSIKNVELPISISLSPNPASQYIHIKANSEEHCKGTIKMFNIIGTLVYEKELLSINNIDEIIPVTSLPIGMYTIVIETPIGFKSELFSIQR
jgi:hypothetical protein